MKFTIARLELKNMIRATRPARPQKTKNLTLIASGSKVFVECAGNVAARDAVVLASGAVTLPIKLFREILDTYKETRLIDFEGSADGLRIQKCRIPVLAYDPAPKPPGGPPVTQPLKPEKP